MKTTTLGNLEEMLVDMEEEFLTLVEETDDSAILTGSNTIYFPTLNLSVKEGIFCNKENGELESDFCLTMIAEGKKDPNNYDYWEQDPIPTALYNYLRATRKKKASYEAIMSLECAILSRNELRFSVINGGAETLPTAAIA